jgi:cyclic-di-GMP phosphodiesterase, flagellum assembly factor TipF
MTALHHILVAVAYTLVAAVAAISAPHFLPHVGPDAGVVIGGVILIGSALMHEVFARQEGEARRVADIVRLNGEIRGVYSALDLAGAEIDRLKKSVKNLGIAGPASTPNHDVESVIAEVKVLQVLVQQLSELRPAARQVASGDIEDQPDFELAENDSTGNDSAENHAAEELARTVTPKTDNTALVAEETKAIASLDGGLNDDAILEIVRGGLEENRVDLVLQPIVRLPQRKRMFYEAFSRIRAEDGSMLVPNQYIGIAEREGLVAAIDNMLLFRCVQLVRRTQSKNANIGFFCNISAHSLTDRHFFANFVEFMADNTQLAPDLIFEFPYAIIANRDEEIERHLRHLAGLGFRFSVDQVLSLSVDYDDLVSLRFKYIKMDAETLLAEVRDPTGPIAVEDIKRVADRHGMDMIVEKIESEEQLLNLLDLRIDYGQGYLFGEPRLARAD